MTQLPEKVGLTIRERADKERDHVENTTKVSLH